MYSGPPYLGVKPSDPLDIKQILVSFLTLIKAETVFIFSQGSPSLPVIQGFIFSFWQYKNGLLSVNTLLEITSLPDKGNLRYLRQILGKIMIPDA